MVFSLLFPQLCINIVIQLGPETPLSPVSKSVYPLESEEYNTVILRSRYSKVLVVHENILQYPLYAALCRKKERKKEAQQSADRYSLRRLILCVQDNFEINVI